MTLPNFLIIGAPKCGTTSVYEYLRQHPAIFMPDTKEPRFFEHDGPSRGFAGPGDRARQGHNVTDLRSYEALFAPVTTERAVGEATVTYLYSPGAALRIHRHVPDAKLIAILRHPVDRAYSNFLHMRRSGREPLGDFEAALRAEPDRIALGWGPFWHYAALGRYREQLERYLGVFPRERLHVTLYDDLEADPLAFVRDLFRFLGVDDGFAPDVSRRYMVGSAPRVRAVTTLLRSTHHLKRALRPLLPDALRRVVLDRETRWNQHRPQLDPGVRARLVEASRDEIVKLGTLIGRDLSPWLRTREPRGKESR